MERFLLSKKRREEIVENIEEMVGDYDDFFDDDED